MLNKTAFVGLLALCASVCPAYAQLDQTFSNLFSKILIEDFQTSPGVHANHYIPASQLANEQLTPALNSLIASNIAAFPLSSTIAGVTFDFSAGQPVQVTESLGPIFAETAETLGDRKLSVGFNATYLPLNSLRGMRLEDMAFTFTHQDIEEAGLGDNVSELDVVTISPNLDADATIFAFYATYGVARNLDVSVAVPFVDVSLSGTARAVISSRTLLAVGAALHFFEGDLTAPVLEDEVEYSESAKGIGDIALRLKLRLPGAAMGLGALLDVRLPTGNEEEFLGTGSVNARALLIGSKKLGTFTPHVNLGYDYRGAAFDSDEIEVALGFDQKIASGFTFALDFLGEFDLDRGETIRLLPGTAIINERMGEASASRTINLSNVPDAEYDSNLYAAFGLRAAPSERLQLLANLLVPLRSAGLLSTVAPTVGLSVSI